MHRLVSYIVFAMLSAGLYSNVMNDFSVKSMFEQFTKEAIPSAKADTVRFH